jgi:hypothetical protein
MKTNFEMEAMERIDLFGKKPELILTPKLTGLFATVGTYLTALRNWGEEQIAGLQSRQAGVVQRRELAKEIRERLLEISDVAKSMEEEGETGMAELFRYPARATYEKLTLTAETFAERAQPIVAQFTECGLAATFVTELRAKVTAFRDATAVKNGGRADRAAGTAGLAATAAAGMKAVRALRPLMRVHLKAQPALLASWKLAARVERARRTTAVETPPVVVPPSGS